MLLSGAVLDMRSATHWVSPTNINGLIALLTRHSSASWDSALRSASTMPRPSTWLTAVVRNKKCTSYFGLLFNQLLIKSNVLVCEFCVRYNKMLQTYVQSIYQCVCTTVTQIPTTVTSVDVHLRMAALCVGICQRSLQVLKLCAIVRSFNSIARFITSLATVSLYYY
jgi:hypothetical protein